MYLFSENFLNKDGFDSRQVVRPDWNFHPKSWTNQVAHSWELIWMEMNRHQQQHFSERSFHSTRASGKNCIKITANHYFTYSHLSKYASSCTSHLTQSTDFFSWSSCRIKVGQAISIQRPRDTKWTPAAEGGGWLVTNFTIRLTSSSWNLQTPLLANSCNSKRQTNFIPAMPLKAQ